MFDIQKYIRPNIARLKPYSSARDEYQGTEGIFLDANENPFGKFNRYPEPYQRELKQELAKRKGVPQDQIFIGNGSDELIDLVFRIFCEPKQDKAITFVPTYGMYQVSADINDVELIKLPLNENFDIETDSISEYLKDRSIKLIFLCSPNNPTGNHLNANAIEYILNNFNGIVIIDEAYIDFSDQSSKISLLDLYPNLIICQTMSKAYGVAAARIGWGFAHPEIIQLFNKVKPPYNVSLPNQQLGIETLKNKSVFENNVKEILQQKEWLIDQLTSLKVVLKMYPSDANFFLIEVDDANAIYQFLIDKKIIVRNRHSVVRNCLRITVGNASENQTFINALKAYTL